MSRSERRDHLLSLLRLRRERAGCAAEFRAEPLAREVGISVVWFYALVGEEFKRLRSDLPGRPAGDEDSVKGLRGEVRQLRAQLRGVKATYAERLRAKLGRAVQHIELLDRENRMLRDTIVALKRRLNEGYEPENK